MAESMAPPLAVRFTEEAMELMRFAVSSPGSDYESLADFVREAVEEKLEAEDIRLRYETVQEALRKLEERSPKNAPARVEMASVVA